LKLCENFFFDGHRGGEHPHLNILIGFLQANKPVQQLHFRS
jgi:hypothetical protein